MFPIAVNFSAGVRVDFVEPDAADVSEAEPLDAEPLDELPPDDVAEDAVVAEDSVVVVDDELSPLLSLAVCEAVSQAARNNVAKTITIRR